MGGTYLLNDIARLKESLTVAPGDLVGAAPLSSAGNILFLASDSGRKRPVGDDGYYTINGNKDIVIHGYEKQALYANATYEWHAAASYLLPVDNVGYLTYGDITLCDVHARETGTDYSEFIYDVRLNGFSSEFEYRLELSNGHVTLWSRLPGGSDSGAVPEPRSLAYLTIVTLILATERKRI